jgi:alpha-N-arabinofuranosidase
MRVTNRTPDVLDEHYYFNMETEAQGRSTEYDKRPRTGPKIFVGEWATRLGTPTPNMSAALGDAAWMTALERNSDLIVMAAYAPLFVNVNRGAMQWRPDLIGYDALTCYGSPSYYAQVMFRQNLGDEVLAVAAQDLPMRQWQPPPIRKGGAIPIPVPTEPVPALFYGATRDSRNGVIILKLVNPLAAPQDVRVEISGVNSVEPKGLAVVLRGGGPNDTNSLQDPRRIAPVTEFTDELGAYFRRTVPPYSITVLRIKCN